MYDAVQDPGGVHIGKVTAPGIIDCMSAQCTALGMSLSAYEKHCCQVNNKHPMGHPGKFVILKAANMSVQVSMMLPAGAHACRRKKTGACLLQEIMDVLSQSWNKPDNQLGLSLPYCSVWKVKPDGKIFPCTSKDSLVSCSRCHNSWHASCRRDNALNGLCGDCTDVARQQSQARQAQAAQWPAAVGAGNARHPAAARQQGPFDSLSSVASSVRKRNHSE